MVTSTRETFSFIMTYQCRNLCWQAHLLSPSWPVIFCLALQAVKMHLLTVDATQHVNSANEYSISYWVTIKTDCNNVPCEAYKTFYPIKISGGCNNHFVRVSNSGLFFTPSCFSLALVRCFSSCEFLMTWSPTIDHYHQTWPRQNLDKPPCKIPILQVIQFKRYCLDRQARPSALSGQKIVKFFWSQMSINGGTVLIFVSVAVSYKSFPHHLHIKSFPGRLSLLPPVGWQNEYQPHGGDALQLDGNHR